MSSKAGTIACAWDASTGKAEAGRPLGFPRLYKEFKTLLWYIDHVSINKQNQQYEGYLLLAVKVCHRVFYVAQELLLLLFLNMSHGWVEERKAHGIQSLSRLPKELKWLLGDQPFTSMCPPLLHLTWKHLLVPLWVSYIMGFSRARKNVSDSHCHYCLKEQQQHTL